MNLNLRRMSAAGNVFHVALDLEVPESEASELACRLSAGLDLEPIGDAGPPAPADGLIIGLRSSTIPRQKMFNPDGSAGHCANGLRCLATLLAEENPSDLDAGVIETMDGPITVAFLAGGVEARIGTVRCLPGFPPPEQAYPISLGDETHTGYLAFVGNPQLVLFGGSELLLRCGELGPLFQEHPLFPDGINVQFVNPDPEGWTVRVWERGAGETMSCGTGAIAVAATGLQGLQAGASRLLNYPGGALTVRMDDEQRFYLAGLVLDEGRYRYLPAPA